LYMTMVNNDAYTYEQFLNLGLGSLLCSFRLTL